MSKFAFASERDHAGTWSVYVMSTSSSNQTSLTLGSKSFTDEHPVWSRDGDRITFVSARDSAVVRTEERQLIKRSLVL